MGIINFFTRKKAKEPRAIRKEAVSQVIEKRIAERQALAERFQKPDNKWRKFDKEWKKEQIDDAIKKIEEDIALFGNSYDLIGCLSGEKIGWQQLKITLEGAARLDSRGEEEAISTAAKNIILYQRCAFKFIKKAA